jgi:tRNA nucleotidyltransferase (CCA-adding enzyme)
MGKESNDIDIALDDMYGEEFAELIRLKEGGKGYGVIKSNSEKSKHLETAVIKI